jgi:pyruvate kinase
LQLRLAEHGLSSLGRAESCTLATVDAVIRALECLAGHPSKPEPGRRSAPVNFAAGQRLLAEHTHQLLGPAPAGRAARIMVTMPTEAGSDYALVHDLLEQGMNCMRINCAHDGPAVWERMIANLRRAEQALGRSCKVVMDLAGPKLRTGPLEPGPAVKKVRPQRDVRGAVTAPARIWLTSRRRPQPPPEPADAVFGVAPAWLEGVRDGLALRLTDARGARRKLLVSGRSTRGCWAESQKTCYFVPETLLWYKHHGKRMHTRIEGVPQRENALALQSGDLLVLTRDARPGAPAVCDAQGRILQPAHIGCTLPNVVTAARPGQPIWFDDGAIGGVIEKIEPDHVLVRITRTEPGGAKLRADKGINLPECHLPLPALTS